MLKCRLQHNYKILSMFRFACSGRTFISIEHIRQSQFKPSFAVGKCNYFLVPDCVSLTSQCILLLTCSPWLESDGAQVFSPGRLMCLTSFCRLMRAESRIP